MLKKIWLFVSIFFVSSCLYAPDNFNADIIIDNLGRFSLTYDGDLIKVPYVQELLDGEITPDNVQEKIKVIEEDLRRDPAFSEVVSRGQGRFKVKYERIGEINPDSMITFIRRDSLILSIEATDDFPIFEVSFKGRYLTPDKQKQIRDMGIKMRGTFRLATNAEVLDHNANKVTENPKAYGGGMVYEWQVDNFKDLIPARIPGKPPAQPPSVTPMLTLRLKQL